MSVLDTVENASNIEVQGRSGNWVADPVTDFSLFLIFEILSEKETRNLSARSLALLNVGRCVVSSLRRWLFAT